MVARETPGRAVEVSVHASAAAMFEALGRDALLSLDVPIGLPEKGPRSCDVEARRLLGRPRGSSVFPAPPRALLGAQTHAEACARRERLEGKRISLQTFGILPKIEEVDTVLRGATPRPVVREGHPELSFRALAGRPMRHSKKRAPGRAERARWIEPLFGAAELERMRGAVRGRDVAFDDLLDAAILLWTAERIVRRKSVRMPALEEHDAKGLPMEIVY